MSESIGCVRHLASNEGAIVLSNKRDLGFSSSMVHLEIHEIDHLGECERNLVDVDVKIFPVEELEQSLVVYTIKLVQRSVQELCDCVGRCHLSSHGVAALTFSQVFQCLGDHH